jgi:hypothetical protein
MKRFARSIRILKSLPPLFYFLSFTTTLCGFVLFQPYMPLEPTLRILIGFAMGLLIAHSCIVWIFREDF